MIKNNKDKIVHDAIYWDVHNWSKAIIYWEEKINKLPNKLRILELGCGPNGGLSLWLASKSYEIICSDITRISETTKQIHKKYKVENNINYFQLDASLLPFRGAFDIICFKSMLGGIVRSNDYKIAIKVISEIYYALKPEGVVLFAENLASSKFHKIMRGRFGALKNNWHYFSIKEVKALFQDFSSFNYKTFGFTGCFGRDEKQKKFLGKIDSAFFDRTLSEQLHYIIAGIAVK